MNSFRAYGSPPYRVVVVHGGPGAAGEMAPVARRLAVGRGVLEPLQTATTVSGQVAELRRVLETQATPPVVLIGFSWGAWLSCLVAAAAPADVAKLILIGSAPFTTGYASGLLAARLERLLPNERDEAGSLLSRVASSSEHISDATWARFGELLSRADAYDPLPETAESFPEQAGIFQAVWPEAERLRREGGLVAAARRISCPVVAIHGDCDPHPVAGVRDPLTASLKDFRIFLLERCGHKPWIERQAQERFYALLNAEVPSAGGETTGRGSTGPG